MFFVIIYLCFANAPPILATLHGARVEIKFNGPTGLLRFKHCVEYRISGLCGEGTIRRSSAFFFSSLHFVSMREGRSAVGCLMSALHNNYDLQGYNHSFTFVTLKLFTPYYALAQVPIDPVFLFLLLDQVVMFCSLKLLTDHVVQLTES